jgi:hypothetical protein
MHLRGVKELTHVEVDELGLGFALHYVELEAGGVLSGGNKLPTRHVGVRGIEDAREEGLDVVDQEVRVLERGTLESVVVAGLKFLV